MRDNEIVQLFSAKASDGTFYAERIVDDLNKTYRNLEYDDVKRANIRFGNIRAARYFR